MLNAVETRNVGFKAINDCTCPGYISSFQCNVTGEGYTVWRGSAFDCQSSGNEIFLLHSDFMGSTVITCNGGQIIGRSLEVTNNCYASQLEVNITTEMEGRTVECAYESGSSAEVIIGSSQLSITTGIIAIGSDCIPSLKMLQVINLLMIGW